MMAVASPIYTAAVQEVIKGLLATARPSLAVDFGRRALPNDRGTPIAAGDDLTAPAAELFEREEVAQ